MKNPLLVLFIVVIFSSCTTGEDYLEAENTTVNISDFKTTKTIPRIPGQYFYSIRFIHEMDIRDIRDIRNKIFLNIPYHVEVINFNSNNQEDIYREVWLVNFIPSEGNRNVKGNELDIILEYYTSVNMINSFVVL